MNDQQFLELLDSAPTNHNITKYLMATRTKLQQYRRIAVSYSGGSDSDTILDLIELVKPEDCGEIKYVFFDTGLEWDATLRQIAKMEKHYGITIERRKAKKPIPVVCKEHGIPFISKDVSEMVERLMRHGFDWNETPEGATAEKYGNCKSAMDWYFDRRPPAKSGKSKLSIAKYRRLMDFFKLTPPHFPISDKCCDYAKKM